MIGIYKITNLVNNKIYIGQSVDIARRFNEHMRRNEQQIDQAIKKYGANNFLFEIVEICDIEILTEREKYWIDYYNCLIPNGYNICYGEGSKFGENQNNSKLTNEDVIFIRTIYDKKEYSSAAQIWRDYFQDKISYGTFYGIMRGESWPHIMPEVFTEENKQYWEERRLKSLSEKQLGEKNRMHIAKEKDVMNMRSLYVTHDIKSICTKYPQYTPRLIKSILSGQNWKHLPVYKKREQRWIFPEGDKN